MSKIKEKWEEIGLLDNIPESDKEKVAQAMEKGGIYLLENDLFEDPSEIGSIFFVLLIKWFLTTGLLNYKYLITEWIFKFKNRELDFWDDGIINALEDFIEQQKQKL